MTVHTEILLIAIAVSIACAIPGVFLVLRHMSMMADAITHTVFLGIVLAFFVTEDLNSPLLLVGATVVGVGTVWLTEMIHNTGLVNEDASIGIIFPLLFSIAIILVSLYSGNAHLDVDTALLGEIAFAPFDRWIVNGTDLGPMDFSWSSGHQPRISYALLQGIATIYLRSTISRALWLHACPHPLRADDHGISHCGGFIPSSRRHPRYRPHDWTCGYRLFMDRLCESHAH